MRKVKPKQVFLISLTILFFLNLSCFCKAYAQRVSKVRLRDHSPGIRISGFKNIVISSFPYGKKKENIGCDPEDRIYSGAEPRFVTSCVDILFKKNGKAYLFDWYNSNIKILDSSLKITGIYKPGNFRIIEANHGKLLRSKNFPYKFQSKFDINEKYIFIRTLNDNFLKLDLTKNDIIKREYSKFIAGENVILIKGDKYYDKVKKFLSSIKKKIKVLDFSFSLENDGSLILALMLKRGTLIYRTDLKDPDFKQIGRVSKKPYIDALLSLVKNKVKIFSSKSNIYIFVFNGCSNWKPNDSISREKRLLYRIGQLYILNKKDLKILSINSIQVNDWDMFTMFNNSIITWDDTFRTKKFNIYRLKYVGDNPRLKDIFNQKSSKKSTNGNIQQ